MPTNDATEHQEQPADSASAPAVDSPQGPREGNALVKASREYIEENAAMSLWATVSTFVVLAGAWTVHAMLPPLAQVGTGLIVGLLVVRGFVLFHDVQHGAMHRGSEWAKRAYGLFGLLVLTPPKVWRDTHNYHHAHNAKLIGSNIGSYPTLSVAIYQKLPPEEQRRYAIARHPLTVLGAYLTVFLIGMCISPLQRDARKNRSAIYALVLHVALGALAFWLGGWAGLFLGFLWPLNVAFITGAYLFYAQHNFEGITLRGRHEWEFTKAALQSSSYMPMGRLMRYFTANIGYHHVHHLNSRIPYYRLPEAMAEVPELRDPIETRLRLRDIVACFRLKLWDADAGKMVPFPPRQEERAEQVEAA